ncbi:MAG: MFS transporter [Bacteroidetes bacterium]|nr:MFS transporter [Bacteroidota bacterium]
MSADQRIPTAARIERLPSSRYMNVAIVLIALGTFWDSYMLFSIGPLSAHFFAFLGQTQLATQLPLALFLGTFVGAVTLSTVADRIGRRNTFALDLSILAMGDLAAVFSPNATFLLISLFVAGIGTGAELPLSVTYVQELVPARKRGWTSSLELAVGFFGGTVGGFVALLLVPVTVLGVPGFKIALLIAAVGGFSSLLIRLRVPESPRWLERVGRLDEADKVTMRIERQIMEEKGVAALEPPRPMEYAVVRKLPTTILVSGQYIRRTISAWVIELLQGFGAYGFATFVPLILFSRGYSIVHALEYTALIQIAYPVGTIISAFITDRIQRKWGMAILYTLNVLAGVGFLFANSVPLILTFGFLTEMFIFLDGPLLHTYEAEIYPTGARGRGAGISFALSRLGGFLAPLVASFILASNAGASGSTLLIALAAGAWLICAITAAVVAVDTTNITLEGLETEATQANEVTSKAA